MPGCGPDGHRPSGRYFLGRSFLSGAAHGGGRQSDREDARQAEQQPEQRAVREERVEPGEQEHEGQDPGTRAGTGLARQAAAPAESIGDVPTRAGALRSLANQLMRLGEQEAAVTACRDAILALGHVAEARRGHPRTARLALSGIEPSEARARCEVLRAQVAAYPWEQVAVGLTVTMSLGLAPIKPGGTVAEALSSADEHLYAAKHHGRNRVES